MLKGALFANCMLIPIFISVSYCVRVCVCVGGGGGGGRDVLIQSVMLEPMLKGTSADNCSLNC